MGKLINEWEVLAKMQGKEGPQQGSGATDFPRVEPGTREYLDDFLSAYREMRHDPDWLPGPSDRQSWIAGARALYNNFNRYVPDFIGWAFKAHLRRFSETRYIASPMSLRYLFEDFNREEYGPKCEICGLHSYWCSGHSEEEEFDWQGRKDIE